MEMHGIAGWTDAIGAAFETRYGISARDHRFPEEREGRLTIRDRIQKKCLIGKSYTVSDIMAITGTGRDCVRKELAKMEREYLAEHAGGRGSGARSTRLWRVAGALEVRARMCAAELSKCFGGYAYSTC